MGSDNVSKCLCMGRIISVYSSDETSTSVENIKSWSVQPGGIAALNAYALSRLGIPTAFIGCVGNDETGLDLRSSLEEHNVDTTGIRLVTNAETAWIWSLRHPNGDRSFHSPEVPMEHFADGQLSTFDIDPVWFEENCIFIPQAGLLGLENGRSAVYFAKEITEKVGGTVFFDANFRRFAWLTRDEAVEQTTAFARSCPFVQISREDAKLLFNVDSIAELQNLLPHTRGILLTKGGLGCDYLLDGNFGSSPGFITNVFDSSLGGDAFFAAFVSKLARFGVNSISDREACQEFTRFANAAAALTITKPRGPNAFSNNNEIEELVSLNNPEAHIKKAANS